MISENVLFMSSDPREIISQSRMTILQVLIVLITFGLNSLDGFDILSISFASPGIAKEWHIAQAALGVVLSMELIGMGLGSFLLGSMADRAGRRPVVLICLVVMTTGMIMVTETGSLLALSFWRVVTGFGIGGLLTAIGSLFGAIVLSFLKLKSNDPSQGSPVVDDEKRNSLAPSVA
jgi:MFS family permease